MKPKTSPSLLFLPALPPPLPTEPPAEGASYGAHSMSHGTVRNYGRYSSQIEQVRTTSTGDPPIRCSVPEHRARSECCRHSVKPASSVAPPPLILSLVIVKLSLSLPRPSPDLAHKFISVPLHGAVNRYVFPLWTFIAALSLSGRPLAFSLYLSPIYPPLSISLFSSIVQAHLVGLDQAPVSGS